MYSTKSIFFTSSVLLYVFSNFVSASDCDDDFAIACLPRTPQPLTFITPLDEMFLLNRTKTSVEVEIVAKTIGHFTGGIFGENLYKFFKFILYWYTPKLDCFQDCYSYTENFLKARVSYHNIKYGSATEAINHPDGIVDILVPIAANAPIENPQFAQFEKIFQEQLKNPGDQIKVNSASTYIWFDHFGPSSVYKTFKGTYIDGQTSQTYPCTTIVELPPDPFVNFISCKQYKNTFGSIKDSLGNPLNNPIPEIIPLSPPTTGCGVNVINVPLL
ncbi:uncharacterized protein LOC135848229 [Planococcus citri]|uniref:uncharacterized protein LOC135848229 n=1 Tax=Planococcus citri TaxID=170843 RepID=UPI0031F846D2